MAVLRVLSVLATPRSTRQVLCEPVLIAKLTALASLWGNTYESMRSFLPCCKEDLPPEVLQAGTTAMVQIYRSAGSQEGAGASRKEGLEDIVIEGVHEMAGTDQEIFDRIVQLLDVPKDAHFALCGRLRLSRAFPVYQARLQWVSVQIMSITVLAQCQAYNGNITTPYVVVNEEQLAELIELLQSENQNLVPLDLQTLALKALSALLSEKTRQTSVLLASTAVSHEGMMSSLIIRAKVLIADEKADNIVERLRFGEALLAFSWMFASSTSGVTALNNSGIMLLIIPAIQNSSARKGRFLTLAVKTLEVLLNYSGDMHQVFRDQNGVNILVERASTEIREMLEEGAAMDMESTSGQPEGSSGAELRRKEDPERLRLLGSILHLLSSAATPIATAADVRELMNGVVLPDLLKAIFDNARRWGASIYEKGAALLTEFIHQEPGCLPQVISLGIAKSVLDSIAGDFPLSRGVVNMIPAVLGALCLSQAGLQIVQDVQPISKFMKSICTDEKVTLLQGDCPSNLGMQLEELMRHNPSLLETCMSGCVDMAKDVTFFAEQAPASSESSDAKANATDADIADAGYLFSAIEFLCKLLEPLMSAAEQARVFVRKGGLSTLLKYIELPQISRDFTKMEAGKLLALVIGKAAFHSPQEILREVIGVTSKALENMQIEGRHVGKNDSAGVQNWNLERVTDRQLVSLELCVSILSGIVGCLRGTSTVFEWHNQGGTAIIQSLVEAYVALRIAAASDLASPAATSDSTSLPSTSIPSTSEPLAGSRVEAVGVLGGVPAVGTSSNGSTASMVPIKTQVANTISSLLTRLSGSASAARRRSDDGRILQSAGQVQERNLATAVATSLKHMLEMDHLSATTLSLSARGVMDCLDTVSACLFGTEDQRSGSSNSRVHLVVIQAFHAAGGIDKLSEMVRDLVGMLKEFDSSMDVADGRSSSQPRNSAVDEISAVVAHSLRVCKRLLTPSLAGSSRGGQQAASSVLDPKRMRSELKRRLFDAVEPLWERTTGSDVTKSPHSSALTSALADLGVLFLSKDEGLPGEISATVSGTLPGVAPRHQVQHDPATVQVLVEMGFEERRVRQALDAIRHNSVELATEWLFSHVDTGASSNENEDEMARALAASLGQSGAGPDTAASVNVPREESSSSAPEKDSDKAESLTGGRAEPTSENIQEARDRQCETLRSRAVDWCVRALGLSGVIDFAIVDLLVSVCSDRDQAQRTVERLIDAGTAESSEFSGEGRSAILQTLAVLTSEDRKSCKFAADRGCLETLSGLLAREYSGQKAPVWLCSSLLMASTIIVQEERDTVAEFNAGLNATSDPGREEHDLAMPGVDSADLNVRKKLMDACIKAIKDTPDARLLQAAMRVACTLARDHALSMVFFHQGGLDAVLAVPQSSAFAGQAILTGTLIRRMFEDASSLQSSMQTEIRSIMVLLTQRQGGGGSRLPQVSHFLVAASPLVQRDPHVFAKALRKSCKVVEQGGTKVISLLERKDDKLAASTGAQDAALGKSVDAGQKADDSMASGSVRRGHSKKQYEGTNQVMTVLVRKFIYDMRASLAKEAKAVVITQTARKSDEEDNMVVDGEKVCSTLAKDEQKEDKIVEGGIKPVNILRYLTDLVKFFPGCSYFLSKYTVEHSAGSEETKPGGTSPRSPRRRGCDRSESFVALLLREVFTAQESIEESANGSGAVSDAGLGDVARQAVSLLHALLAFRGSETRKKVLGEMVSSLTAAPRRSMGTHLAMLRGIADVLFNFTAPAGNLEVTRMVLEHKVPAAICMALAQIDLHHPAASKTCHALLRPLDVLCSSPDPAAATQQRNKDPEGSAAGISQRESGEPQSGGGRLAEASGAGGSAEAISISLQDSESHGDTWTIGAADVSAIAQDRDSSMVLHMEGSGHSGGVGAAQAPIPELSHELSRDVVVLERSYDEMDEEHEDEDEREDDDEDEEEDDDDEDEDEDDDESVDDDDDEEIDVSVHNDQVALGDEDSRDYGEDDDSLTDLIHEDMGHGPPNLFETGRMLSHVIHNMQPPGIHDSVQLDHVMERFIGGNGANLVRHEHASLEGMEGMEMEIEGGPQHQVLSLLLPEARGHLDTARILDDIFPNAGLQDMQVIRLPVSRGGGGQGSASNVSRRVAPQDMPLGEHPMLARRSETSRGDGGPLIFGSDGFPRGIGYGPIPPMGSRGGFGPGSFGQARRDGMLLGGGLLDLRPPRSIFGYGSGHGGGYGGGGGDDLNNGASAARWTDDGGNASPEGRRSAALQLENALVSALYVAPPPPATRSRTQTPPEKSPIEATAVAHPAQWPASAPQNADGAEARARDIIDTMSTDIAAEVPEPELTRSAVGTGSTATAEGIHVSQSEAADEVGTDAMDEDDDDDELALALRMSTEADSLAPSIQMAETEPPSASAAPAAEARSNDGAQPQAEIEGFFSNENAEQSGNAQGTSTSEEYGTGGGSIGGVGTIDPTFLAELPEELRAEVVAQQAREQAVQHLNSTASSAIDPDFLAALPPDIQADVIRQHQREEAAQRRQEAAANEPAADTSRIEEMDNASFLATLSDELRQEVLLTSDDEFLATLPPHLVAESQLLRERASGLSSRYALSVRHAAAGAPASNASAGQRQSAASGRGVTGEVRAVAGSSRGAVHSVPRRQIIEVEHAESIVRLLFLTPPIVRTLTQRMLLRLLEHSATRDVALRFLLATLILMYAPQGSDGKAAAGNVRGVQRLYGCCTVGLMAEGSAMSQLAKRALEALVHVATHKPALVVLLLREAFLDADVEERAMTLHHTISANESAVQGTQRTSAFSLLLLLLSTDLFAKSSTLQEQLLRLLHAAALASNVEALPGLDGQDLLPEKLPKLTRQQLLSLSYAMSSPGCSNKVMERATALLKTLAAEPSNLVACIAHFIAEVQAEAVKLRELLEKLPLGGAVPPAEVAAAIASANLAPHDIKVLRLVRVLRALWPQQHAKPSTGGAETEASDGASVAAGARGPSDDKAGPEEESKLSEGRAITIAVESKLESRTSLGQALANERVWELLGECLSAVESSDVLQKASASAPSPALSRLQPLIQAFLVVKLDEDEIPRQAAAAGVSGPMPAPTVPVAMPCSYPGKSDGSMEVDSEDGATGDKPPFEPLSFLAFAELHRASLNSLIRQDKSLLHSGALAPLVNYPKLLDFDNKKHFFRSELKVRGANRYASLRINVRRDHVFEDSFHQIVLRKPDELKGKLSVTFQGEEGIDAGGLTREWYLTVSKQMLNPDKALFIHSANGLTYQPNPASTIQPDHLKYFKFAGQVVGKALYDDQLLDCHFTLSMYKHMLKEPIEYKDVESIDPEYFRNLGWMLENDITDILEETFSIVREQFGEMLTIDLKPNGRNLPVTEENKHEYVQLVAEQQMTRGIKEQIEAFKDGFHQFMPPELISIFTCKELELLMCGLPSIDVEDLRANTEYNGYSRDSPQITWFWETVQSLGQEDLARLVQFVTGTSQVPMEGFKALRGMNGPQKFNIHRCGDSARLPSSHTCFNQLDLPEYPSSDHLRKSLLNAVREGFEGFGFS